MFRPSLILVKLTLVSRIHFYLSQKKFADTLYTCNAGALSTISSVLDEAGIPIIMTSDVNMDYIFLKEEHFTKALYTLEQNGCKITNEMGDTTA